MVTNTPLHKQLQTYVTSSRSYLKYFGMGLTIKIPGDYNKRCLISSTMSTIVTAGSIIINDILCFSHQVNSSEFGHPAMHSNVIIAIVTLLQYLEKFIRKTSSYTLGTYLSSKQTKINVQQQQQKTL